MGLIKFVLSIVSSSLFLLAMLGLLLFGYIQYKGIEAIWEDVFESSERDEDCFLNYVQITDKFNVTNYICDKWENRSFLRGEEDS